MSIVLHPAVEDRVALGKAAREQVAPSAHAGWTPAAGRPDPVGLLEEQDATREPDLVPVRHGRMMVSPFTFYRGAAKIMAADLKDTPRAGLEVQCCGDAHLSNFGVYASPERTLLFDLNDFDETLPGPFEYDVKRMSASFTIAARNNGFTKADARATTLASVTAYREAMASLAEMRTLDIWYAHLSEQELMDAIKHAAGAKKGVEGSGSTSRPRSRPRRRLRRRTAATACRPCRSWPSRSTAGTGSSVPDRSWSRCVTWLRASVCRLRSSRASSTNSSAPTERPCRMIDAGCWSDSKWSTWPARSWVSAASGHERSSSCFKDRDEQDPLFLQVKEATASVLEDHLPKSQYKQAGERVVQGQRMMQAASDIFLGWTKGHQANRYLYWRQLRDMKGSALVDVMGPAQLRVLRGRVRLDPGAGPRSLRRSSRARGIPRQEGPVRSVDHRLLRALRRPERAGLQAFVEAIRSGRLEAIEGV